MATGRSSFAKRQRDMAKKARAEAKRQKRLGRGELYELEHGRQEDDDVATLSLNPQTLSNDEIMAKVEDLHRRYDDGQLDLETFDEQRSSLMAQIAVD